MDKDKERESWFVQTVKKEEEREGEGEGQRDRTERFRAHLAKSARILHNVAASMHLDLFPGSFQMSLNQRLARSRWRRPWVETLNIAPSDYLDGKEIKNENKLTLVATEPFVPCNRFGNRFCWRMHIQGVQNIGIRNCVIILIL